MTKILLVENAFEKDFNLFGKSEIKYFDSSPTIFEFCVPSCKGLLKHLLNEPTGTRHVNCSGSTRPCTRPSVSKSLCASFERDTVPPHEVDKSRNKNQKLSLSYRHFELSTLEFCFNSTCEPYQHSTTKSKVFNNHLHQPSHFETLQKIFTVVVFPLEIL